MYQLKLKEIKKIWGFLITLQTILLILPLVFSTTKEKTWEAMGVDPVSADQTLRIYFLSFYSISFILAILSLWAPQLLLKSVPDKNPNHFFSVSITSMSLVVAISVYGSFLQLFTLVNEGLCLGAFGILLQLYRWPRKSLSEEMMGKEFIETHAKT